MNTSDKQFARALAINIPLAILTKSKVDAERKGDNPKYVAIITEAVRIGATELKDIEGNNDYLQ